MLSGPTDLYRPSMPVSKAFSVMSEMVGTAVVGDCLSALKRPIASAGQTLASGGAKRDARARPFTIGRASHISDRVAVTYHGKIV
jgi:hypothetical protein